MDSKRMIIPGDRITARASSLAWSDTSFIVGTVLFQDWYGDRVKAGASDCWGYDVEFKDDRGNYHHWKQNQDHGIVERKEGQYWLPVSDDGCLRAGDQITIHWTDEASNDAGYAIVKYEGVDYSRHHVFRSITYGWKYLLSMDLKTMTHENHPYEPLKPDNSTGWMRFIP